MNKLFTTKRPFSLLLIVLCLVSLLAPLGLAAAPEEPTSELLVTLTEPADLTVSFWYDHSFPEVTLIAPSGTEYPLNASTPGLNIVINAEYALAQITEAEAGNWYIRYTVGDNTEFEYALMGMTENIWIQYVTAEQAAGNRIAATFLATLGEERTRYDYKLYLTYDATGASSVLLKEGYAYTGEEQILNLDFSDFASYETYVLLLEVEIAGDEVTLFDNLESDPFAFENDDTLASPGGIDVTVDLTERMVTADWSDYTASRYDGYRVVFTDMAGEVLHSLDFEGDATEVTQYITDKTAGTTLTFYGKRGALLSEPLTRTITFEDRLSVVTTSPTASSQAQIKMNLPTDTVLSVGVGGTVQEFTSEGKENVVAITLENGSNSLSASFVLEDVTYTLSAEIYKDGNPPVIDFYEPYQDKVFPNGKATLVGSVGDAVSLLLNGEEVALEGGLFQISLNLSAGENEFLFEAKDAVGNLSSFKLTLYGDSNSLSTTVAGSTDSPFWLPLIIGGVLAIACIVFSIVLAARKKHLKAFSTTSLIVFFACTTAAALAMFIWQIVRKAQMTETATTYGFMEIVRQSLDNAYAFLLDLGNADSKIALWMWIFLGSLAALLIVILVHVLLRVFAAKKRVEDSDSGKNKKAKKAAPKAQPATITPTVTVEDAPIAEEPVTEEPVTEEPVTEEPAVDAPAVDKEASASDSTSETESSETPNE